MPRKLFTSKEIFFALMESNDYCFYFFKTIIFIDVRSFRRANFYYFIYISIMFNFLLTHYSWSLLVEYHFPILFWTVSTKLEDNFTHPHPY